MPTSQDEMNALYFVNRGCEYYAVARFAMYAQRSLICGNLFHHAVEMLLKSGLANKGKSLDELESMRHNLRKLWRSYKAEYPRTELERHNKTIKSLDKCEEIRYPKPEIIHSIVINLEWSDTPPEAKAFGGLKTPRQSPLVVDKIDDLVADLLRGEWYPDQIMGRNEAALEAIKRNNAHAEFLTSPSNPGA